MQLPPGNLWALRCNWTVSPAFQKVCVSLEEDQRAILGYFGEDFLQAGKCECEKMQPQISKNFAIACERGLAAKTLAPATCESTCESRG